MLTYEIYSATRSEAKLHWRHPGPCVIALGPGVDFLNLGIHQPLSGRRPSNLHTSKPSTRWLGVQGTFQLESVEITNPILARRLRVGRYMLTPCDRARVQGHGESDIPQASHKRSQITSHCDGDLPDQVRAIQSYLNADLHRPRREP